MTGTIIVNGEPRPSRGETVRELVAALGLDPGQPGLAVAVNGKVTPRARWTDTRLDPGDRVEVVRARAGG